MVLLMERIDHILPLSVNFVAILPLIQDGDGRLPGHLQLSRLLGHPLTIGAARSPPT